MPKVPEIRALAASKRDSTRAAHNQYTQWESGPTPDTYAELMKSLEPTISSALRTHGGGDPALLTKARILASEAVRSYDVKRGAALNSHVFNHLQRLNRVRAQRGQAIHVPESMEVDRRRIHTYSQSYIEQHGVDPSNRKISDGVALSLKRVRQATGSGEAPESQFLSDKGDAVAQKRDPYDIWVEYVHHDLAEKDRRVLEWATGYKGAVLLPKTEIAKRLKISPAAVSQRITRIQKKLEEGLEIA